jgi:hypothetical protein
MDPVSQRIVRAQLPGGAVVGVQAHRVGSAEEDVSALGKVLDFKGVIDSIESIATAMTEALAKAKPHKAGVEFGVDVGVESGGLTALLVKGSGTATLTITLEWESSQTAGGGNG